MLRKHEDGCASSKTKQPIEVTKTYKSQKIKQTIIYQGKNDLPKDLTKNAETENSLREKEQNSPEEMSNLIMIPKIPKDLPNETYVAYEVAQETILKLSPNV